jgi:hypothetical protein
VAKRPPSSCTIGLSSGGITGTTSRIIHSGLFPDVRNASTTSSLLIARIFFWPLDSSSSFRSSFASASRSISINSSFIASAPIPARKLFPKFTILSRYSLSFKTCFFDSRVCPGSITTYEAKYNIFSSALGDMSSKSPMRLGIPLKYHICDTGAASSICPILSRRTFERVTSTPQRSQTMPLYLMRLYFPQWHSQSRVGPNILSQNSPSLSGFRVL